ncbi:low molecular weight protein tyrosine phosphatase family protein [Undibacterium cyanobacteriorum]|uniref:Low molecular weight protein tyrosine phosphatase family protein n=1 Tax=Undibacterium cyanobacteriorum TaxID=3073561 RepID=A0ABY9RF92_9BURK|nr:low molecular weight protein tyrosine phosphatase family protein [Undibacterium sp. 20NA77.5]WMW79896.1 low molecular weight protein tyrosine phosphatase family protein [Undibacterium sp. 20NA77.5]
MHRALFICTQNRLRSPTAEQVFAAWPNVETDSAGLGNDANVPLSSEQITWSTIIFVMEKAHRNRLSKKFSAYLKNKRVVCLDIPDEYDYMDPVLIQILKAKVARFLA